MQLLRELGVAGRLFPQARPVRGVRLHGHGVRAQIEFSSPGWSLPRAVLDDALLDAARSAGAAVVRARVEDCIEGGRCPRVALRLPDGALQHVEAATVIAADGLHSLVARKCGLSRERPSGSRFALGGHYRELPALDEYIDMFVHGTGYVAVNPLSDDTANVMLIVDERDLKNHQHDVDAFAQTRAREPRRRVARRRAA